MKPFNCRLAILTIALLGLFSACGRASANQHVIGVLSVAKSAAVPGLGSEQRSGYDFGLRTTGMQLIYKDLEEDEPQSDIQRKFRADVQDQKIPMLALLGGTSNSATSHAAALANFFNVPMLVPTANGDGIFPSNNMWAFRLSAPGEAYAKYFFGSVIIKQEMEKQAEEASATLLSTPELRVAILYEADTFGESAAVATAEAIMAQSIKIGVYTSFQPENTDPAGLKALAEKVRKEDAQLVYLISSDPAVAKIVVQTFRTAFDEYSIPLLVGQAGGFASQDFLNSPEAEGVYVLRQQVDLTDCHEDEIKSTYEAQSYAAVYLLDWAIHEANKDTAENGPHFSLFQQPDDVVQAQREAIRDALKESDLNVPCLGPVAFDNTGQNKYLNLEIIHISNGMLEVTSPADFLEALKIRLGYDKVQ